MARSVQVHDAQSLVVDKWCRPMAFQYSRQCSLLPQSLPPFLARHRLYLQQYLHHLLPLHRRTRRQSTQTHRFRITQTSAHNQTVRPAIMVPQIQLAAILYQICHATTITLVINLAIHSSYTRPLTQRVAALMYDLGMVARFKAALMLARSSTSSVSLVTQILTRATTSTRGESATITTLPLTSAFTSRMLASLLTGMYLVVRSALLTTLVIEKGSHN